MKKGNLRKLTVAVFAMLLTVGGNSYAHESLGANSKGEVSSATRSVPNLDGGLVERIASNNQVEDLDLSHPVTGDKEKSDLLTIVKNMPENLQSVANEHGVDVIHEDSPNGLITEKPFALSGKLEFYQDKVSVENVYYMIITRYLSDNMIASTNDWVDIYEHEWKPYENLGSMNAHSALAESMTYVYTGNFAGDNTKANIRAKSLEFAVDFIEGIIHSELVDYSLKDNGYESYSIAALHKDSEVSVYTGIIDGELVNPLEIPEGVTHTMYVKDEISTTNNVNYQEALLVSEGLTNPIYILVD